MSDNIIKVKEILGIIDNKMDYYLYFCENSIKNRILDICNIEIIPERLNSLIQEFLIQQYKLNQNGIGSGQMLAVSASDNGQTVNFKTVGGVEGMSKDVNDFLDKNMDILLKYRKIGW